jgi:hypothetical protein
MGSADIAARLPRVVPGAFLHIKVSISICCAKLAVKIWQTFIGGPIMRFQMFPITGHYLEMRNP